MPRTALLVTLPPEAPSRGAHSACLRHDGQSRSSPLPSPDADHVLLTGRHGEVVRRLAEAYRKA